LELILDKHCQRKAHPMASVTATIVVAVASVASETTSSVTESSTPAQGALESAGQGISGGTAFSFLLVGLALTF
jgi:hypothetical protein